MGGTIADFGKNTPAAVTLRTRGRAEHRRSIGNTIGDKGTRRRHI
jgi:hypothetical protein